VETPAPSVRFDLPAFRAAASLRDTAAWAEFYADQAKWIEYRHNAPPRAPHRLVGKAQIAAFLRAVAAENITLVLSDERAAFSLTCTFLDGRRIVEHTILHLKDSQITRQVDVEAWD
jgi:hypothetical protein